MLQEVWVSSASSKPKFNVGVPTVVVRVQLKCVCRIKFCFPPTDWRASVASETLTGVSQSKIGDVCLFRYMNGRMYVILYFDPPVFVLVMWSTPSQIAPNRILWFIDQYPYHPRN